jgi:DNA invertase Pin-like site-specific DNA recombinase
LPVNQCHDPHNEECASVFEQNLEVQEMPLRQMAEQEEFRTVGVQFISHQEALDTSSPMGEAMFAIIAAMAQLERRITLERVVAGLDYARSHGTKSGRGLGRPRRSAERRAKNPVPFQQFATILKTCLLFSDACAVNA